MGGVKLNEVYKRSESVIPSTYSASSFSVLIDGDCTLSPITRIQMPPIDTMYRYAADHIPNYDTIITYPNDPEYNPNTNGVTNFSRAFFNMSYCRDSIGSIMNRFDCNSCTDMSETFRTCYNLTGSIPNIPNSVTNMSYAFFNCSNLSSSNVYIHSNNISNATSCFYNMRNTMNIYVHAGTTYNTFYKAMGNSTYNNKWKCYLKTF